LNVQYVGPHDEVEVPTLAVSCKRGESIEVADDVGLTLVQQDAWLSTTTKPAVSIRKEGVANGSL
jgi:hypothetical protein